MSLHRAIAAWTACTVILLSTACAPREKPVAVPVADHWESGMQAAPAPATPTGPAAVAGAESAGHAGAASPAVDPIIAVVNGSVITQAKLADMLIESHGLQALEQLILLIAVRQRAAELGLAVTDADIQAAHDEALNRLAAPVTDPDAERLSRQQAERLLNEFLAAKNISRSEWDCRMEQRAYVTRIAQAEVALSSITDEMLREEYNRSYGEKVQIRHIQLSTLEAVRRARELLAGGRDFELVARQMSENERTAAEGGLTRPFARADPGVTPAVREAAFALDVAQVSEPVREQETYHIIRLERRFPASDVGFENVDRDKLRSRLVERLTDQRQQALEIELFRNARVEIRNAELRRQFRAKHGQ